MKISALALLVALRSATALAPPAFSRAPSTTSTSLYGYLDSLGEVNPKDDEEEVDDSREATALAKDQVDRYSVGNWDGFVDFDEFDGGDGQMGVAGDGNKKLEKFDNMEVLPKSRDISAKNAWGTSTGYADKLRATGMDTARAQQLENWKNQQEVLLRRKEQRYLTEEFDNRQESADESWRDLAKFGVERNQDFDLNEAFGAVQLGEIEGVIELKSRLNGAAGAFEFPLRNPYMGFADFRAAFTADTPLGFEVTPSEGSLRQKEDTIFVVKYKAQQPGIVEGYLVVETEDFKKTYKVIGSTA